MNKTNRFVMVGALIGAVVGFALLPTFLASKKTSQMPATICVASSLKNVVSEIQAMWILRGGRGYQMISGSSSELARQIAGGLPGVIFISADPQWLSTVTTHDSCHWLSNSLVAVAHVDQGEVDLRTVSSMALAGETVPVGMYARQALASLHIPIPERVIEGFSARDVLSKVSAGGAQVGVVYATDAAIDPRVKVIFQFPEGCHDKVIYAAGLLDPDASDFFETLQEPWAKEIALRHGFRLLP
ncbi:MAG: molybdate ABC transporter substrate-binding protein [Planctomycetota bacterium]